MRIDETRRGLASGEEKLWVNNSPERTNLHFFLADVMLRKNLNPAITLKRNAKLTFKDFLNICTISEVKILPKLHSHNGLKLFRIGIVTAIQSNGEKLCRQRGSNSRPCIPWNHQNLQLLFHFRNSHEKTVHKFNYQEVMKAMTQWFGKVLCARSLKRNFHPWIFFYHEIVDRAVKEINLCAKFLPLF